MGDDLQRYRPEYPGFMMPDPDGVWVDRRDVADRIEELEATLLATCKREAATQARHDAKVVALEAERDALAEKLEKVDDVFSREIARVEQIMTDIDPPHRVSLVSVIKEYRLMWNEITGGKTDDHTD